MFAGAAALRETFEGQYWPLAVLCGSAWLVLFAFDTNLGVPAVCSDGSLLFAASASIAAMEPVSSAWGLPLAWLLMIAAMMSPLLQPAVAHVWERTLSDRRWRGVWLFAIGYLFAWAPTLVLSGALGVALRSALTSTWNSVLFACGLAVAWHGTAMKLDLLNRCHVMLPLPAFGISAEFARFRFGLSMGGRCVGTCWALMTVPMTLDAGHLLCMLGAAALMLNERFQSPEQPRNRPIWLIVGSAMCLKALAQV